MFLENALNVIIDMENGKELLALSLAAMLVLAIAYSVLRSIYDVIQHNKRQNEWELKPEFVINEYAGGWFTISRKSSRYTDGYFKLGEIRDDNTLQYSRDKDLKFGTKLSAREAIDKHYAAVNADKVVDTIPYIKDNSQDRKRGSEILDLLDESISGEKEIELIKELRNIY